MHAIGNETNLTTGKADGLLTELGDGHGQKRHRNHLARGQKRIHLARVGTIGNGACKRHEVVGRLAHGRDYGDNTIASTLATDDALGDTPDALRIRDGCSAEFCNYYRHARNTSKKTCISGPISHFRTLLVLYPP